MKHLSLVLLVSLVVFPAWGADTKFSIKRGFFEQPFDVEISSTDPEATVRYTLDGTTPTASTGQVYAGPIRIDRTSIIRAAAFRDIVAVSNVDTQTYLFIADIVTQPAKPPGWPTGKVNDQVLDYGMDPDVVTSAQWGPQMLAALTAVPTLSVVTDLPNLMDPAKGIYVNASKKGKDWERPASVELIHPQATPGFQINAGLRIRGGYSRHSGNPKHSFRLLFRKEYGKKELKYPIFGDEGVDHFRQIDLATAQNYSWSGENNASNTFLRDLFSHDSQRDLGQPYARNRFCHLYLNGYYWGLYNLQERTEAEYAESYFGGSAEDYDVVKAPAPIEATDGTLDAWRSIWQAVQPGIAPEQFYPQVLRHVDIDNLIDYMLLIFFTGNLDAPISWFGSNDWPNNWYGIFNRAGLMKFRFFMHDSEHTLTNVGIDRTGPFPAGKTFDRSNPQWLHQRLMAHPAYRLRFADRVQAYLFNGGLLTPAVAAERVRKRAKQIETAIIAESARWGDAKKQPWEAPFTKIDWERAVGFITDSYLPVRPAIFLDQLRRTKLMEGTLAPLFPPTEIVTFLVNDRPQHGGTVSAKDAIAILARQGKIYYGLDGQDPRNEDGSVSSSALQLDGGILEWQPLLAGGSWEYWDREAAPATDWKFFASGGLAWPSGPAPLGYGNGNEATVIDFGPDPAAKRATAYFRSRFEFQPSAEISSVSARLMVDDGAVVYLNGQEIGRINMPAGPITHQMFAAAVLPGEQETHWFEVDIPVQLLHAGTNAIAVEVHQGVPHSSDLAMALEVRKQVYRVTPFTLNKSTTLVARARNGEDWSPALRASFTIK